MKMMKLQLIMELRESVGPAKSELAKLLCLLYVSTVQK